MGTLLKHVYGKHERNLCTYRLRDFCPLCGARFFGDTPESIMRDISEHIDTDYCKEHWLPLGEAIKDTGEDIKALPFITVTTLTKLPAW